ncbi:DUF6168 family protein [Mariniflexile ostreae]|uniref:DUF6168 family protein n=1 Tax=Mariniflexile ostreae TaxID=1520892 RepID=A0ABV5F711_9FLAO
MIKRILYVVGILVVLFLVSFNLHNYLVTDPPAYSLLHVYLFHLISAVIVYVLMEFMASELPSQAGYTYLALIFFKIGAFVLFFQDSVFYNDNLSQSERIGLVVPLFLFLMTEAISIAKLLNSK